MDCPMAATYLSPYPCIRFMNATTNICSFYCTSNLFIYLVFIRNLREKCMHATCLEAVFLNRSVHTHTHTPPGCWPSTLLRRGCPTRPAQKMSSSRHPMSSCLRCVLLAFNFDSKFDSKFEWCFWGGALISDGPSACRSFMPHGSLI